jgi:hypothetical protein
MAKFGLLYLNEGGYGGTQTISADWVHGALQPYSKDAWTIHVGQNFNDVGYGYQWWCARGATTLSTWHGDMADS